jgi:raffinose/stachyose/melibiose transport system substrate-binding protein
MDKMVADYQAQFPNVTIAREAKTMDDLKTTTALALKSEESPDVVMVNQGESDMGALVKAGLLVPLNDYASKYGWLEKFPASLVRLNSWTADGSKMGEGNFYGLPQQAELVGVYYRKDLFQKYNIAVPTTFAEFEAAIDTLKKNGETPITFGNLDGWPAIHIFSNLQGVYQGNRDWFDNFMFTSGKVDFNTPENLQAATTLQNWAKDGVVMKDFAGVGYDDAWGLFSAGQGAMLITGSWLSGDLASSPHISDIGFFLIPPKDAGGYALTVGGTGFAFAISAKCKNPDLAAEYINYMYSEKTAKLLLDAGYLPVYPVDTSSLPDGLLKDIATSWTKLNTTNSVGYYMDWVTPTMYDTITASLQELMGGKATPEQFITKVNDDYTKSLQTKGITITR